MSVIFVDHQLTPSNPKPKCAHAFTRIELTAAVVGLTLLCVVALPLFGTTRADSERAGCFNNLRQIGHAVRQWSGDHFEEPPWLTRVSEGGTRPDTGSKTGAAWTEYLSLSNELVTPRILACPGDANVKVATQWSTGPNALVNAAFRQQAISYLLGLHANSIRPQALVGGDFNLRLPASAANCGPAAVNNASTINTTVGVPTLGPVQWTNGPHAAAAGHLLVVDGSVTFLDSMGLARRLTTWNSTDNGTHHLLRAH